MWLYVVAVLVVCISAPGNAVAADRALLIGVAKYEAGGISSLPGTQTDVDNVHDMLTNGFDLPSEAIKVLRNEQATHNGILDAIDQWLIAGTESGDRVFIYYSGHGYYVPDVSGDESTESGGDGLDETLVAYDANCDQNGNCWNMVLDDELAVRLKALSDRYVLSVFDSCHSGTVTRSFKRHRTGTSKLFSPNVLRGEVAQGANSADTASTRGMGKGALNTTSPQAKTRPSTIAHNRESGAVEFQGDHVSIFAVQSFQEALETKGPDNVPAGLFTQSLVDAILHQRADYNTDNVVSFAEVRRYTREASDRHCRQSPGDCGSNGLDPLIELPPQLEGMNVYEYGVKSVSESAAPVDALGVSSILSQGNDANLRVTLQPGNTLREGELLQIKVTSDREGLLYLFDRNTNGELTPLYPATDAQDARMDGKPAGWVRPGSVVLIPDSLADWEYEIEPPYGSGVLVAVLAEHYAAEPTAFRAFEPVARQEQSLGTLAQELNTLISDPENESLRRTPQWSVALVSYEVVPR